MKNLKPGRCDCLPSDGGNYVQPTVGADRGRLHLEARYNYENLETGSAWLGVNFSGGKALEWAFTPLLGGVFGDTTGIAPGFAGSLSWRMIELSSENEYVVDAGNRSDSFFYNCVQSGRRQAPVRVGGRRDVLTLGQ